MFAYLDDKDRPYKPPCSWCIVVTFVDKVSSDTTATFTALWKGDKLDSQQCQSIKVLQTTYQIMANANGSQDWKDGSRTDGRTWVVSADGR